MMTLTDVLFSEDAVEESDASASKKSESDPDRRVDAAVCLDLISSESSTSMSS